MHWGIVIIFILTLTFLEVVAEISLKPHNHSGSNFFTKNYLILIGILLYVFIAILLAVLLRLTANSEGTKLGVINTTWQALNIVIVFLVSLFVFKEKFKAWQVVGVVLAMLAAIIMIVAD